MKDQLKAYWEKAKVLRSKVPKKSWIIAGIALVVIAAAITVALNNRPYSVLFTGLNAEETSAIMSYLETQGVGDYRIENSDTILVPKKQESQLKAKLLMEGYPRSGFSYSTYYDHVNALSTEAERNRAYLNDLEQRMGAVIRCFDGVKSATVIIAQGENRTYVLDSANMVGASASVHLTMQGGQKLTSEQANAIRNFVARGMQGLEMASVVITDSYGNTFSGAGDGAADGDASALKLKLEEENNNKIRTNIMQVLAPLFGEDNVRIGVNCTVDVSHTIENATDVRLPDWAEDGSTKGEGIISSKIYDHVIVKGDGAAVGGVVGTESNADLSTYVEQNANPDGSERQIEVSGQVDYNNPTSQTQIERTAGYITDCNVSVSINSTTAGLVDVDAIRAHIARAAGINVTPTQTMSETQLLEQKISVLTMPFYVPPQTMLPIAPDAEIEMWMVYAAAAGLLVFALLMLIIWRVRAARKKKRLRANKQDIEQLFEFTQQPQAQPAGANIMSMQTERSMELRQDIRQFAEENPEITAQMLRSWMRGGEDNG